MDAYYNDITGNISKYFSLEISKIEAEYAFDYGGELSDGKLQSGLTAN